MQNTAPHPSTARDEAKQQIRQWLGTNITIYTKQEAQPGAAWQAASTACREVFEEALTACERAWAAKGE